jgi:hypothetical protein
MLHRHSITLLLATCSLMASPAHAQPILDSLQGCLKVTDDLRRLTCYDNVLDYGRGGVAGTKIQASQPPAPAAEQEFGLQPNRVRQLRGLSVSKDKQRPASLSAHVGKVTLMPYGRRQYTLDNGQVWLQTEDQDLFIVKPGDAVTIVPGLLGTFWFQTDEKHGVHAKRIR